MWLFMDMDIFSNFTKSANMITSWKPRNLKSIIQNNEIDEITSYDLCTKVEPALQPPINTATPLLIWPKQKFSQSFFLLKKETL